MEGGRPLPGAGSRHAGAKGCADGPRVLAKHGRGGTGGLELLGRERQGSGGADALDSVGRERHLKAGADALDWVRPERQGPMQLDFERVEYLLKISFFSVKSIFLLSLFGLLIF